MMVVITAIIGYAIASAGTWNIYVISMLAIGGFLLTCGSNIFNQLLERDYDRQMKRTENRPLAAGRMTVSSAVILGGLSSLVGLIVLSMISPLCGVLGSLSFVSYSFIYTPLKRVSTWSVAVGAIPGALPVLIGCVAAQGTVTQLALALFLIQFVWQFPHFWAIGYLGAEDYIKAGFKVVPTSGNTVDKKIGLHSVLYCIVILALSAWTFYAGILSSSWAVIALLSIGVLFTVAAIRFALSMNRKTALQLMFASIIYMPLSLIIFLIDLI